MPTKSIGRAKIRTAAGKTTVTPIRSRQSVSRKIGAEKQADRKANAWAAASKGRASVYRKGAQ